MRARSRRQTDMGDRVSENVHANPAEDPHFLALMAQLDQLRLEAKEAARRQREGITKSRGASELKQSLQAQIRRTHLPHLAHAATSAAQEQPDILPSYRITKDARTVRGFSTIAGTMIAAAQSQHELLLKHGLVQSVLDDLVTMMERFDQAVLQGVEARRVHVGASADLEAIGDRIVRIVQTMDGFQRLRFARDPEKLAAWESASTVHAKPQPSAEETEDPGATPSNEKPDDVRPAA
jgi:hypothetical protein